MENNKLSLKQILVLWSFILIILLWIFLTLCWGFYTIIGILDWSHYALPFLMMFFLPSLLFWLLFTYFWIKFFRKKYRYYLYKDNLSNKWYIKEYYFIILILWLLFIWLFIWFFMWSFIWIISSILLLILYIWYKSIKKVKNNKK